MKRAATETEETSRAEALTTLEEVRIALVVREGAMQTALRRLAASGLAGRQEFLAWQGLLRQLGDQTRDLTAFARARLAPDGTLAPLVRVAEWEELAEAVTAGVRWVYDAPEGDAYGITHHGPYCPRAFGHTHLRVCPAGVEAHPIVIFEVQPNDYPAEGTEAPEWFFTPEEAERLEALVSAAAPVRDRWNGAGCRSLSVQLARPAPAHVVARRVAPPATWRGN